jgi:hypothetical protein
VEIDVEKLHIEQIGLEGGEILRPPVTTQVVESMTENSNQAKEQCHHIAEMSRCQCWGLVGAGQFWVESRKF